MKNRTKVIHWRRGRRYAHGGRGGWHRNSYGSATWTAQVPRHRLRELRGQTVLITGGSRGLGWRWRKSLPHFGAKIAICARDEQELARARQQLEDLGAVVCAVLAM